MKSLERFLIGVLAVLLSAVLGTSSAAACSCVDMNRSEQVESADVVVRVIIERTKVSEQDSRVTFIMRPTHLWKGDIDSRFELTTELEVVSCGLGALKEGSDLLLFAHEYEDGRFSASWCGGTSGATESQVAELVDVAGPGVALGNPTGDAASIEAWATVSAQVLMTLLGGGLSALLFLSLLRW